MPDKKQRVVVVGASPKPGGYSYRAVCLLRQQGHEVIPVHPATRTIQGLPVVASVAEIDGPVDTLTLYVSAKISATLTAAIKKLPSCGGCK